MQILPGPSQKTACSLVDTSQAAGLRVRTRYLCQTKRCQGRRTHHLRRPPPRELEAHEDGQRAFNPTGAGANPAKLVSAVEEREILMGLITPRSPDLCGCKSRLRYMSVVLAATVILIGIGLVYLYRHHQYTMARRRRIKVEGEAFEPPQGDR